MNPSTAQAAVLIDELVAGGVAEAVLCPGSRSAPLAFALHGADIARRLRLHVRTDERTAGFLALGLARASGRPVPVVTTSGTAVANLHPAVLEAHHAAVPLLVLSADRPSRLRDVGANQVIDQMTVFGSGALRYQHEFAVAQRGLGQNGYWRGQICRAIAGATGALHGGRPGPVQLNIPFDVPLVPDLDATGGDARARRRAESGTTGSRHTESSETARYDAILAGSRSVQHWPEPLIGRGEPWTRIAPSPSPRSMADEDAGAHARRVARPAQAGIAAPQHDEKCLFVADVTSGAAGAIAAQGYPVISEAGGAAGARVLSAGIHLLADDGFLAAHRPDRVIVLGRPTMFRPIADLLRTPGLVVDVVDHPHAFADAGGTVRAVAPDLDDVISAAEVSPDAWLRAWRDADGKARDAADQVLARCSIHASAVAARVTAGALPTGAALVLGSSQPPRDLGLFSAPRDGVALFANRGVAGIDGTISTAAGVALARSAAGAGATYALMGDLTFLHDVTGLAIGPREPLPDVTIVVVNNDGGGIFQTLEQGAPEHADAFERVFGTPTGARLESIATGLGAEHLLVSTAGELAEVLAAVPHGLRVVEVLTSRDELRSLLADVAGAVRAALAALAAHTDDGPTDSRRPRA